MRYRKIFAGCLLSTFMFVSDAPAQQVPLRTAELQYADGHGKTQYVAAATSRRRRRRVVVVRKRSKRKSAAIVGGSAAGGAAIGALAGGGKGAGIGAIAGGAAGYIYDRKTHKKRRVVER